ncbi:right-handed parallel beta-helix repeat-containing protein, partial [Candidatus Babeliales bacterium]|nr:right-handed parallel beta-helix repeat-containing protein [Candidatus Babeliales bacterium]
MKWILLIVGLMLLVGIALAATPPTVYIDTDGSGDYDCDGTDDHVQINQALAFVGSTAGYTTVHLNGSNTYWIDLTLNMYENSIFQGDSDAEIKLINNAGWASSVPLISNTTDGSTNFTIQGFTISGNSENQPESVGAGYYNLMYFYNCNNITVDNMRLEWGLGDGLKVYALGAYIGDPTFVTFTNNSVYRLGHDALYCVRINNITAHDNDIFARANSAIRLSDSGNATIYDNELYSSTSLVIQDLSGPGIQIDINPTRVVYDIEIYNNTIHTLKGSGILITNENNVDAINAYDVHIHHNTFYNVGQYTIDSGYQNAAITIGHSNNTIIENNIIDNGGHAGIKYFIKPAYYKIQADFTTIVRNNIIINTDGQTTSPPGPGAGIWNCNDTRHTFISDNNCFYNNTELYNGTNITYSNDIQQDPLFYNESDNDYHLNSTIGTWNGTEWEVMTTYSPCIDAGKTTSDYSLEPIPNGGIINIGRYGGTVYASKSTPVVTFIDPTLDNNSITVNNYVEVNASISTNNLTDFIWNWNSTNYTLLNNSCVMYLSLNNNSAIGESSTTVVDVSPAGVNGSIIDTVNNTWTDD